MKISKQWPDKLEYPFQSQFEQIHGAKMHFIDQGKGDVILFVHGTPSWSFDFRHIIKVCSQRYRCIAIDHIGFGLSEKPKNYDYTTLHHSEILEEFILRKNLQQITLVVHDFGGPIAMNIAIKHPERFHKILVLNSWLWSSANDASYTKLRRVLKSPLLPILYRYFNFSARFILPSSFGEKKIKSQVLKQYTGAFPNKDSRNACLAFAKSLLNDQDWFESLWLSKSTIENKPVLLVWGLKDPVISANYLNKFIAGFPNSKTIRLETCGHFPQEEAPDEVTEALLKFMDDVKI